MYEIVAITFKPPSLKGEERWIEDVPEETLCKAIEELQRIQNSIDVQAKILRDSFVLAIPLPDRYLREKRVVLRSKETKESVV